VNLWKLLIVGLISVVSPVLAQNGGGNRANLEVLMEKLDLTDEQRTSLSDCVEPCSGRTFTMSLVKERTKLNEMLRNKDVSDDQIREQIDEVNKAQAAWNTHRLEKMLTIRRVLTSDQLGKLEGLREEFGPPGAHSRGGCGGRAGW
jgi:Spy/CpxP family protein refolding chaperone